MTSDFHRLTVAEIRSEISGGATSVTFDVPAHLSDTFHWTAGQHLTLRFDLDGQEQRRCYSICNPPGERLRITVKRVKGGLVSNHIGDRLRPGDTVEVMPPFGGFALTPGAVARRTHYFFGAGSGITPLYAMIRTVLRDEPHSVAHLVFGNRSEREILFREELEGLAEEYSERFTLRHVLSSPSVFSWFRPWATGRIDAGAVSAAIEETPLVAQDTQYWICGPDGMNADISAALMGLDVPAHRIHMESFGDGNAGSDATVSGVAAMARITLDGTPHEVQLAADQTILQAARAAGVTPPFSCQSGVCGACRARLTAGRVHMRARMALEDADIARGEILTCQAVAQSERLEVVFPEDR